MPNNAGSLSTYTTMMRVTSTGRPYCQDLHDLFAALVIQHGLRDHRYRFRTIPGSFVFAEVIDVLGHLQFTHVMKTPDPANPSRLIATRTTTTFSMSPNMARTLSQFFATSRLIENAVDPTNRVMKDKAIWVLTPKGKFALQNFGKRAQVSIESLHSALAKIDSFDVVVLERLPEHDDKLAFARPNMTVAFKTLMAYLPLESLLADDAGGIDKENLEEYQYAFYGYQAFEWISEYTTVVTREEAEMVAAEFVLYGWISQVLDKSDSENNKRDDSVIFKMTRNTLYHVTLRGRQVLGWDKPRKSASHSQLEDHEYIIKKQKALAARLKSGDTPPPTIQSAPAKANKVSVQSSAASMSSASTEASSVSSDSTSSTQQIATDSDNVTVTNFNGNEHLEYSFSGEQSADMKAVKPKDNLDEVTEKLLQMRSPGQSTGGEAEEEKTTIKMKRHESEDGQQKTSATIVSSSSSSSSPSRPSSMVFASAFAAQDTTDFITSAPLDGNQQLDPHSHWAKLRQILEDPLVRMYFRDFMKSQFCEENVNIWVDYHTLRKKCRKGSAPPKELLKDAFVIYDTYLAPGAKSEVNIDHSLRHEIISYVTSVFEIRDVDGQAQIGSVPFMTSTYQQPQQITIVLTGNTTECLRTLLKLYDRVNEHICRIMAQDSVPKFIKTNKYRELMANPPPPMCRDSTESGSN